MSDQKKLDPDALAESMRVETVTSSFSTETRNRGIKSSSFVSYTVRCKNDGGWNMDEARLVEAILAERVSKDLYADLGSRRQVNLSEIKTQQQLITRNYDKLIENISKAANEPVDTDALVDVAVEVENG